LRPVGGTFDAGTGAGDSEVVACVEAVPVFVAEVVTLAAVSEEGCSEAPGTSVLAAAGAAKVNTSMATAATAGERIRGG
jgi:hypothetical protein